MARRERRVSDLDALFASEVGDDGGGDVNPFAMAMQLLGMQAQRRQGREEREFEREKLAEARGFEREKLTSEERRAAEKLGLDTRQQVEAELTGRTGRELAAAQEQRLGDAATAAVAQQKFANQLAQQKLIADALEKVAGVPQLSPEAQVMIEQLPGMAEPLRRGRGQAELAKIDPMLRAAYGEAPDKRDAAIAAVYGRMSPYARENAPWQDLNALIKPEVSRPAGATPTATNMLQNAPAVGRNVGRYAANVFPNILRSLGMNVGTWPYEELGTSPVASPPSVSPPSDGATVGGESQAPWYAPMVSGMTPSPEVYEGFPRPANSGPPSGGGFNIGDFLGAIQERGSRPVDFIKPGPRFDINNLLRMVQGERQRNYDATRME